MNILHIHVPIQHPRTVSTEGSDFSREDFSREELLSPASLVNAFVSCVAFCDHMRGLGFQNSRNNTRLDTKTYFISINCLSVLFLSQISRGSAFLSLSCGKLCEKIFPPKKDQWQSGGRCLQGRKFFKADSPGAGGQDACPSCVREPLKFCESQRKDPLQPKDQTRGWL